MKKDFVLIAEVKTKSPFGWKSEKSWDELFTIADKIGDIISIHTDPRWGGSFELLKKARALTNKPILAKGMHKNDTDIKDALESGADWVLVVGRIPNVHQEQCIIEPISLSELKTIPSHFRVLWNTRDLKTGKQKTEMFEEARKIWKGWLCQGSFIKSIDDVKPGADAILVGTNLPLFAESLKKLTHGD